MAWSGYPTRGEGYPLNLGILFFARHDNRTVKINIRELWIVSSYLWLDAKPTIRVIIRVVTLLKSSTIYIII